MLDNVFDPCSSHDFELVRQTVHRATLYSSAAETLAWDERTGMPSANSNYRGRQIALLETDAHRCLTSSEYGEALNQLNDAAASWDEGVHRDERSAVVDLHRRYTKHRCLPDDLVNELSQAKVEAQSNWDRCRRADDFASFQPSLQNVLTLTRQVGQRIADQCGGSVYDALLDEYEPGAKSDQIEKLFAQLKPKLVALLQQVHQKEAVDTSAFQNEFDVARQKDLCRKVTAQIGYDYARGRLDETSHPFCTSLGPDDIRILTRYQRNWFPSGLYGSLHEAGHGIYEQGLRSEWFGFAPGQYLSLGVHESQSRLWENQVGRSMAFCRYLLPMLHERFESLRGMGVKSLYRSVNAMGSTLIRVEADELTYNLHILIRFELERQLIAGDLNVADLPSVWNERYREDLHIDVPNDRDGVLQDVHWAAGLIGYFPTYTLGNIMAAQWDQAIRREIPNLDEQIAEGKFDPLLAWLRENVHRHGRCYEVDELLNRATGTSLDAGPLLRHLEAKIAST